MPTQMELALAAAVAAIETVSRMSSAEIRAARRLSVTLVAGPASSTRAGRSLTQGNEDRTTVASSIRRWWQVDPLLQVQLAEILQQSISRGVPVPSPPSQEETAILDQYVPESDPYVCAYCMVLYDTATAGDDPNTCRACQLRMFRSVYQEQTPDAQTERVEQPPRPRKARAPKPKVEKAVPSTVWDRLNQDDS